MAKKRKAKKIKTPTISLKFLLGAVTIIGLIIFLVTFNAGTKSPQKNLLTTLPVRVGSTQFEVSVSDEPREYTQGLMGKDTLPSDSGMLFILPGEYRPVFWMKNMKFPLDIIWIKDNRVLDIHEEVPIPTGSRFLTYSPKENVNMVLEVAAGTVKKNQIQIGDLLWFDKQQLIDVRENTKSN